MRNQRMTRVMMAVGAAAVLIAAGSARAVERNDGTKASAHQEAFRDPSGGEPSYPARATKASVNADGSGYVTRDELRKHDQALLERLEREPNAQVSTPTFTDAG